MLQEDVEGEALVRNKVWGHPPQSLLVLTIHRLRPHPVSKLIESRAGSICSEIYSLF